MNAEGIMKLVAYDIRNSPVAFGSDNRCTSGVTTVELDKISDTEYRTDFTENIVKRADIFSPRCIRVDYEDGTGEKRNDLFKYYAIKCKNIKHVWGDINDRYMLTADMNFFNDTHDDYAKHYDTASTYKMYFNYLCPNGMLTRYFVKDVSENPVGSHYIDSTFILTLNEHVVNVKSIKLICDMYFLDDRPRKRMRTIDLKHIYTHDSPEKIAITKKYGQKYSCQRTWFNKSHKSTHKLYQINGVCNGFFIKVDKGEISKLKINLLEKCVLELLDVVDVDTYTYKFNDWTYVPFDTYLRKIKTIEDCFYFNADGAPDLTRINMLEVNISGTEEYDRVDYMFPLHLMTTIHDMHGEITQLNLAKQVATGLCGCHPASERFDHRNYYDFCDS